MKRLIIITVILIAATAVVTVAYFKHLSPPGKRATQVINTIPESAALIFEFNNDSSFYDIYKNSDLFSAIVGQPAIKQFNALRHVLLNSPDLHGIFADQDIFISVHPQLNDSVGYLFTATEGMRINPETFTNAAKLKGTTFTPVNFGKSRGYQIHSDSLEADFYLAERAGQVITGSFSKTLLQESLDYKPSKKRKHFELLPDQQNSTSLGALYINYRQAGHLLNQFYRKDKLDLWKGLPILPAVTSLSLNYKRDALMFNGFTTFKNNQAVSYLDLFRKMNPVPVQLKNLFPSTTAYSNSYAIDDVKRFESELNNWQQIAGLNVQKKKLFTKIKSETGVQFDREFNRLLDNEFAVITTRFQERVAIIKVKNGGALRPYLNNISTMDTDDERGQFNYDQVPVFVLGDALAYFRKPHFMVLDNYLILANTERELSNYRENYVNGDFLIRKEEYAQFNNLLAQRANVEFFIHFKNAGNVFRRTLKSAYAKAYQQQDPGFKNYYAAAYQLSASENQFYTNLCIKLNSTDSTALSN